MIRRITTRANDGTENGHLITLWNREEDTWKPDQVYVTVVKAGCMKGPHLHMKRRGRFVCISGAVDIVMRGGNGDYWSHRTSDGNRMVVVSPGVPAAIYNVGQTDAVVVNMPDPAWTPAEPDEHVVENWDYQPHV